MKRNSEPKPGRVLTSRVYPIRLPLLLKDEELRSFHIFKGITKNLLDISCHASALLSGQSPHAPHAHKEEELLLLLSGNIDIILPDRISPEQNQCIHLKRGQFVYYPYRFFHTIRAMGELPANYLVFRWYTVLEKNDSDLSFSCFDMANPGEQSIPKDGFYSRRIFEGSTNCLQKVHCHISILLPGAGYEPHSDNYDVSILVLEGELETLGQRAKPYDVVFYVAGEPHGIYNRGTTTARYIVFEFHAHNKTFKRVFKIFANIFTKVTDSDRWKRKLKQLLNFFHYSR
jgi:uncharacterized cupin superfamily protein